MYNSGARNSCRGDLDSLLNASSDLQVARFCRRPPTHNGKPDFFATRWPTEEIGAISSRPVAQQISSRRRSRFPLTHGGDRRNFVRTYSYAADFIAIHYGSRFRRRFATIDVTKFIAIRVPRHRDGRDVSTEITTCRDETGRRVWVQIPAKSSRFSFF
ncbi:hypothetical protein L484_004906 [Morus notabilis]|uniref:Uncharacterized protein n=1 Tax=Morus notabilis TaxID=981085 RepID=W9R3S5_9ROSA|nr:hypothetical protein L484_004906 [Morus notabilis]